MHSQETISTFIIVSQIDFDNHDNYTSLIYCHEEAFVYSYPTYVTGKRVKEQQGILCGGVIFTGKLQRSTET